VLFLIIPDRNQVGAVEENVRGHQDRIVKQPYMDVRCTVADLVFELCHSLQLAHGRHAVEHPGQLRVRGNVGLQENLTPFRIDSTGKEERHEFNRSSLQISGSLRHRDGVKIRQEKKRLMGRLQINPVFHGADVVSDHQRSGRLNPAQHQWSKLSGHLVSPMYGSVHAHTGLFHWENPKVQAAPARPSSHASSLRSNRACSAHSGA
jgi:hypothetical protein